MVLNYIWLAFFLIGFFVALGKWMIEGDLAVFPAIVDSLHALAKVSVEISLGLIGVMALWLGFMKIGERGGAIDVLTRLVSPFFRRLFPEIPSGHPAMGSMVMNFAANMLGLDNAATPLGLKAMAQLQELNVEKDRASNAQIMFLVLNTSGLTIIPVSVIALRVAQGAANPTDIFIPILVATFASTLCGLLVVSTIQRINLFQPVVLGYLLGGMGLIGGMLWYFTRLEPDAMAAQSQFLGAFIICGIIFGFLSLAMVRQVNVYEAFIDGAKEGFEVAVKIIPYLVAMLVAIGVFRKSGAMGLLLDAVRWVASPFGDTRWVDALPVALMKPLSGSGARGAAVETMETFGPDSFAGTLA
ncbi:MAG: nucleoside recognition domain-containing protein, partial [Verrucomicrobiota bacterium]